MLDKSLIRLRWLQTQTARMSGRRFANGKKRGCASGGSLDIMPDSRLVRLSGTFGEFPRIDAQSQDRFIRQLRNRLARCLVFLLKDDRSGAGVDHEAPLNDVAQISFALARGLIVEHRAPLRGSIIATGLFGTGLQVELDGFARPCRLDGLRWRQFDRDASLGCGGIASGGHVIGADRCRPRRGPEIHRSLLLESDNGRPSRPSHERRGQAAPFASYRQ
ncbi:hypothetical protein [Bosea sp. 2RAB26]|uniref:hypothetical protein n=1 Tax=Bosea sp. 2RAB26 TaxID=3237476 RepID=UPI003F9126BD